MDTREDMPHLAYHNTNPENAESILQDGFDGEQASETHRAAVEDFIVAVAERVGASLPVDRRNAVYFWPERDQAIRNRPDDMGPLSSDTDTLVVDLEQVEGPMCVADFQVASNLLDSGYRGVGDPTELFVNTASEEEFLEDGAVQLAQKYIDSMVAVQSPQEIEQATENIDLPELIIGGDTPSSAVVDVLSYRQKSAEGHS